MAISVLHGCDGGCIVVLTPRDVGGGGASDGDEGGGQTRWNCMEGEVVTHDHVIYSIRITYHKERLTKVYIYNIIF